MWTENGFTGMGHMREAHGLILTVIPPALKNVLELGCGNGELLKRIECENKFGVDFRSDIVKVAQSNCPEGRFLSVFLKDALTNRELPGQYDLVLLAPTRLMGLTEQERRDLLAQLKEQTRYVLLYFYGSMLDNDSAFAILWKSGFGGDTWRHVTDAQLAGCVVMLLEKK